MSNIEGAKTRPSFFPNAKPKPKSADATNLQKTILKRNDYSRMQELNNSSRQDAKVDIPEAIKDFSRIKRSVDASKPIDNSAKIADLKAQINAGTYKVDYEALADKMIQSEF